MARKFGGPNGYGHISDGPNHGRLPVSRLLFGVERKISIAETPKSVDLRPFAAAMMDQSMSSSCTSHGYSAALFGTARGLNIQFASWFPAFVPSQKGLYDATRSVERARGHVHGAPLPPFVDQGAQPADVATAISTIGVRARRPLPDDDSRNSDVDPATVNDEHKLGELEEESQTLIVGEHFLDHAADDYIAQIRATLAARIWIPFAIFCDTSGPRSVEEWDPKTGPLGAPDEGDSHGGGHLVAMAGYDTLTTGETEVIFQNSWGTDWGLGGYGQGNEDFIHGTSNALAMSIRRAA